MPSDHGQRRLLPTRNRGTFRFTVTAVGRDGQRTRVTVRYGVRRRPI